MRPQVSEWLVKALSGSVARHYVCEVPDVIVGHTGPKVNTHSGYQHTLAYGEAVAAWTDEPVQADPVETTRIPPLPV